MSFQIMTFPALLTLFLVAQTVRDVAHRPDPCGREHYIGYVLFGVEKRDIPPGVVSGESVYVIANDEDWKTRVQATPSADLASLLKPQFPDDRVVLVGPTLHPILCASTTVRACTSFIALTLGQAPPEKKPTPGGCAFLLRLKEFTGHVEVWRETHGN